jgi:hypothetical protein
MGPPPFYSGEGWPLGAEMDESEIMVDTGGAVEAILGEATSPEESRLLKMLALMYLELVTIKEIIENNSGAE